MKWTAVLLLTLTALATWASSSGSSPYAITTEVEPGELGHVFRCEADTVGGGGFRYRLVVLSTHPGLQQEHHVILRVGQPLGRLIRTYLAGESVPDGVAYTVSGNREIVNDVWLDFSHKVGRTQSNRAWRFQVGKWYETSD